MRLPGHTTVVAYLALFVALGTGGAYAISVERNSIKSRHLADDSVTRGHVGDDTIGPDQTGKLPYGVMSAPPDNYVSADEPVTYNDAPIAQPNDAFNVRKGTFRAPVDGLYDLVGLIVWAGPHPAGSVSLRIVELDADGSPGPTVIGPTSVVNANNWSTLHEPLRLKTGDVLQMIVTNKDPGGASSSASFSIQFLSG